MPRLIDADALVQMPWVLPNRMTRETALECFRNIVSEAPTIDAEPVRHGRWITVGTPFGKERECSVCHNRDNPETAIAGCYCWFCGAKMDGGAE